jgi:hypothetical protein
MSIRVYGSDQDPAVGIFLYRCSNSSGTNIVTSGRGRFIKFTIDGTERRAVQLLEGAEACDDALAKESIGLSALIPFGRVLNPMLAPQPLLYEIPHAGDRTCFARHRRHKIRVSSRSRFSRQVLPAAAISAGTQL